jgi:hypothetical protein
MLEDRITPSSTFAPTVNTDGVSFNGQVNTLRDAILAANRDTGTGTDTIQLQGNTTYTLSIANTNGHDSIGTEGDLNISNTSHALVIQGIADVAGNPTTIIDQTALDRVFQIVNPGTTVTFKNLIIEGGFARDNGAAGAAAFSTEVDGGGILDDGGNVTLSNVILQNNSAEAGSGFAVKGGGIYVGNGGSLTVSSSLIQSNHVIGSMGDSSAPNGGVAQGGGVYTTGATSIANSALSNNVVSGGEGFGDAGTGGNAQGGGIFAADSTTLTNSTLNGNSLTGGLSSTNVGGDAEGGGLYFATQGTATLTSCTLMGNTLVGGRGTLTDLGIFNSDVGGDAEGGGVFAAGRVSISDSNLSGNSLTGGHGDLGNDATTITGDIGGSAEGGGVFASGPTTITTSTLANNKLTGGVGGEVSGSHNGSIGGVASGGGLFFSGQGNNTLAITASTLSGNTLLGGNNDNGTQFTGTAQGGGAFLFDSSSATLVNSTIASNKVTGGVGGPTDLVATGGGLLILDATVTLTNDTVANNLAIAQGSGLGESSGGGITNRGSLTLVNTLVANNGALLDSDIDGAVSTNSGHNLIGDADGSTGFSAANGNLLGSTGNAINPQLGTLSNNGGPTQTLALLSGSPAINAGDNSAQSVTGPFDQRGQGFARVVNGTIDIGAFEAQPPPSPPPPLPSSNPPPTLHTPSLLAFFDALLGGVETVNSNGTETVTDSFFGIPLFVSTYDSVGNLESVTLFGMNVTLLFELL